jgi:hypothetical protein
MPETSNPKINPEAAKSAPAKKRRILRRVLLGIGVFLVVCILGIVYLHSSHAFAHVLMPILANRVDGKLEVKSGSVSLFGRMSIEGFSFVGPDEALSLRANSLMASADPWSFIFGDIPRIHRIEVIAPEVIVRAPAEPEEIELEEEEEKKPGEPGRIIPVEINELLVQDLLLEYYKGDQKEFTLTEADVAIKDIEPSASGTVSVKTNFAVAPDDENRRRSGTFAYDLALAQNASGDEITWDGKGATRVREGIAGATAGDEASPQEFSSTLKGLYSDQRAFQTRGELQAQSDGATVGTIAVDLNWKGNGEQPDDMSSSIQLTGIQKEFLNPIVGLFGPTQFESAQFDGTATVKSAGDAFDFDSSLMGKNVSVRASKTDEPTPPLGIESVQSGQIKQDGSKLTVAQAQLRVEQGGQPKIAASLDQPLTLAMSDEEETPARDTPAVPDANFNLRISDLSIENLRPWAAMANSDALEQMEHGSINGDLVIKVVNQGERISVDGNSEISNLVLRAEGETESRGPFTIRNESKVQVQDLKQIQIESVHSQITLDNDRLGELITSGEVNTESGKMDLNVKSTAGDLGRMLTQLGIAVNETIAMAGGALEGETKLVRENNDSPLAISGNYDLQKLALSSDDGKVERSAKVQYSVSFDPKMTLAKVDQLALNLFQNGQEPAGNLTVKGQWPLSEETEAGAQADITLAGFDAKPWMTLFGANQLEPAEGEEPPALAVDAGLIEAKFTVAQANSKSPMALNGDLGVKNLLFTSPKDRTLERIATLKFDVEIDADRTLAKFDELTLALAEPNGTPAGRLSATGQWPLQQAENADAPKREQANRARPSGRAEVRLAEFNAEPWVRVMGWAEGQDIGPVPIEAEEIITIDSTGKNITFEGEERIGPVRLTSGDQAPEEVTMTIQNKFQKVDEELRGIVVDLASNRGGGKIDKARVEGSGTLGERPSLQLAGAIESLAADIYTKPFQTEEAAEETSGAAAEAPAPQPPAETPAGPAEPITEASPIDLDINLKIGEIGYNGAILKGGALIVKADKELMQTSLQPATLNGGPIQADFNMRVLEGQRQIQWTASGTALPTERLIGAFNPENANTFEKGMLQFQTTGLGTGTGDQLKETLEGNFSFAVTDGRFGEVKLLSYIAEVTGVGEFDKMFFNGFNGAIKIDDGWATIEEVIVAGPVAQLIGTGKIGLDGALDVYVNPRVGPTIAERVPKEKYSQALLGVVEGFTVLPVAVTVRGTTDSPSYGVRPTTPEVLKDLGGLFKGVVGGVTGTAGAVGETKPVEAIKDTLSGAIRGLTGGKKEEDK